MVLIDMEMPGRCEKCPCVFIGWGVYSDDVCKVTNSVIPWETLRTGRMPDCPLREVEENA